MHQRPRWGHAFAGGIRGRPTRAERYQPGRYGEGGGHSCPRAFSCSLPAEFPRSFQAHGTVGHGVTALGVPSVGPSLPVRGHADHLDGACIRVDMICVLWRTDTMTDTEAGNTPNMNDVVAKTRCSSNASRRGSTVVEQPGISGMRWPVPGPGP